MAHKLCSTGNIELLNLEEPPYDDENDNIKDEEFVRNFFHPAPERKKMKNVR